MRYVSSALTTFPVTDAPPQLSSLLPLLPLPPTHPIVQMFQIKTLNEIHQPSEHELKLCEMLLSPGMFPHSAWIMSGRACVLYHMHGKHPMVSC